MKKKIRLYRNHDMDLISIYKNEKVNFAKLIRECLHTIAAGKQIYYYIPANVKIKGEVKSIYQILLNLDEKKDKDIIEYLKNAKFRQVNALIKAIVRSCIVAPLYFNCLENPDCYDVVEIPALINPPLKYTNKTNKKANKNISKTISKPLLNDLNDLNDIENKKISHNINEDCDKSTKDIKDLTSVKKDIKNNADADVDADTTNNFFNSLQGLLSQF